MWFDDPKICALYLNDALDTDEAGEVARALRDLRRAKRTKVQSLNGGCHMHLAEMFDILASSGVRLIAVPTRPSVRAGAADEEAADGAEASGEEPQGAAPAESRPASRG